MVRKITTVIDFPKLCGPDCVPVVVPKNYKPDLSFISADLFKMHLKEHCFPDCWKALSFASMFQNDGEVCG